MTGALGDHHAVVAELLPEVATVVPLSPAGRALLLVEPRPSDDVEAPRATVLASSGLGGAWFDWVGVADALPDDVRLLVVDRPGAGGAPAWVDRQWELDRVADDLVAALDAAAVEHAVLVGHSMGAWYVEACARRHPDRVAGLLLLDGSTAPVPPFPPGPTDRSVPLRRAGAALVDALVRHVPPTVTQRVGPWLRTRLEGSIPSSPSHRARARAVYSRAVVWRAAGYEWAAYPRLRNQLARMRVSTPLPSIPVHAVTAASGVVPAVLSLWVRTQRHQTEQLAANDPSAVLRRSTVRPAPHMLMLTHPERVAAAVVDVVVSAGATSISSNSPDLPLLRKP